MMWLAWDYHQSKPLKEGDKRTRRRFALFPTLVDVEEDPPMYVWFEHYYEYQELSYWGYGETKWHTLARYSAVPV